MFISDEAPARPLAQADTLETAHQLTPQRTKIKQARIRFLIFFTAGADFVCGQSINWAWQAMPGKTPPRPTAVLSEPTQPTRSAKALAPGGVGAEDNYGNGLIHQLAVLEKKTREICHAESQIHYPPQIHPRPPTHTSIRDDMFSETRCHPESDSLGSRSNIKSNSQMLGRKQKL